ncbi:MAG: hypothetical protein DRJ50_14425, partial [Actinobacteria bacterium]
FAGFYTLLALIGPNGLLPSFVWPDNNQHLLQVRAWLGEDIDLESIGPGEDLHIDVEPRLDVTPYFEHRVIAHPRDRAMLANLAIVIPGPPGGPALLPAQSELGNDPDNEEQLARVICHVGFPPGPAFIMLPLRLLFRSALATQWLSAILGGLAIALIDLLLRMWTIDRPELRTPLLVLSGFGTLWMWIVPDGGTSFFAQVVATTALVGALVALIGKRCFLGGCALAIAITSRVSMIGILPIVVWLLWKEKPSRRVSALLKAALAPAIAGALTLVLNHLRFGSVFDFGYFYMFTPPELLHRLLEHGQLSLVYLGKNIQYLVCEPPMSIRNGDGALVFPYFASNPYGMGLFFVTPAFLAIFVNLHPRCLTRSRTIVTWLSLFLICLPGLLYFNTGWVQWGGRFLLDAWPLFLMLTAWGLERAPMRLVFALVALSCLSNFWAVLLSVLRIWPGCCL